MLKPYSELERNNSHTTYVFHTGYVWLLYALLAIMLLGFLLGSTPLMGSGITGMALYLALITTRYRGINKRIRAAMKAGNVQMSGSKFSFKKPLTVRLPNN